MKRREFLSVSTALAALPVAALAAADPPEAAADRDYLELRLYHLDTPEQRKGLDRFVAEAAIPALNRLGISPVGAFYPLEELSPVYLLLRHPTLESVASLTDRLAADEPFVSAGAEFLNAPADQPAYRRIESSLLRAFSGMPHVERPIESPGRIFQLRIYESPSEKTGLKKIEMFNDAGEIAIFRRVGLHPVFFGQTLIGSKMPNLTYLLSFESAEQLKANWKKFGGDPGWQHLRTLDEYADKNILSGITNLLLKPADYSQL